MEIDPKHLDAINDKGVALQDLEGYEEADKCFKKIIDIDPNYVFGWINLGFNKFSLENDEEALKYLDKSIELDDTVPVAWYFKGLCLENLGRYKEALEAFNRALKLVPDELEYLNAKVDVLILLEEYEKALKLIDYILNSSPDDILALFNKGIVNYQLDKPKQALENFKNVVKLDPENIDALNYLGIIYNSQGNPIEAISCYDKALEISPDYKFALINKGTTLKESKKFEDALKCIDKLITEDPNYPEAWYEKGNILRELRKEKEFIKTYENFVKLVEENDYTKMKLIAKRVKEYLRLKKEGEPVSLSPPEKPQYWQWVTKPEFYINPDGTENEYLSPEFGPEPGDNWTCHKDTQIGDLILLYRAGKKDGVTYQDIKYLIQAQSDAYTLDYDEQAFEHGWQYGCDYKPLFKFENSINYHELKKDPYLEDWNALRKQFQGIAFKTDERHWKRLQDLLIERNPEYKEFLKSFKPKEVIETCMSEKNVEDKLSKNLNVLQKFGYDLNLLGRQVRCTGQGGRIDLFCEDKNNDSLVVIELKIVKATRNTFGQISNYVGWAIRRKADGKNVKGIVISRGYDNEFDSAQITNDNINYIELAEVLDELGMKLK